MGPRQRAGSHLSARPAQSSSDVIDGATGGGSGQGVGIGDVDDDLHRVASAKGVGPLLTLLVIGSDGMPGFDCHDAQPHHAAVSRGGPVPATISQATQLHELAAAFPRRARFGPLGFRLAMCSQPIAARDAGADSRRSRARRVRHLPGPRVDSGPSTLHHPRPAYGTIGTSSQLGCAGPLPIVVVPA